MHKCCGFHSVMSLGTGIIFHGKIWRKSQPQPSLLYLAKMFKAHTHMYCLSHRGRDVPFYNECSHKSLQYISIFPLMEYSSARISEGFIPLQYYFCCYRCLYYFYLLWQSQGLHISILFPPYPRPMCTCHHGFSTIFPFSPPPSISFIQLAS